MVSLKQCKLSSCGQALLSSHDLASCEADSAKQDCVNVGSHQTNQTRFFKRWGNKHKKHLVACTFEPFKFDDDERDTMD